MRKLIGFRINHGGGVPSYIFEWQNTNEAGAVELYRYRGIEPPRPELQEAADRVANVATKMVELPTDRQALFHNIDMEYPAKMKNGYKLRIKATAPIQRGYLFTFSTPVWDVFYPADKGELNNTIRDAVLALMQECWKYIDGDRAQVKLDLGEDEKEKEK